MDEHPDLMRAVAREDPGTLERIRDLGRRGGPQVTEAELREAIRYAKMRAPQAPPVPPPPRVSAPRLPTLPELPRLTARPELPALERPERPGERASADRPVLPSVEARGDGFEVRAHARDIDRAYALARLAGDAGDATPKALASYPDAEAVFVTPDGTLFVRIAGSAALVKLTPLKGNGGGKPKFEHALVEPAELAHALDETSRVAVTLGGGADAALVVHVLARPPPDAKPFTIATGRGKVQAALDGDRVILSVGDAPAEARAELYRLSEWLPRDAAALRKAVAAGKGELAAPRRPQGADDVVAALREGRQADAAAAIARDPEGARRQLDAHRDAGLRRVDRLLNAGRPVEALAAVRDLAVVHGETCPELKARRGEGYDTLGRAEESDPYL
jgi:hypothetical protein